MSRKLLSMIACQLLDPEQVTDNKVSRHSMNIQDNNFCVESTKKSDKNKRNYEKENRMLQASPIISKEVDNKSRLGFFVPEN